MSQSCRRITTSGITWKSTRNGFEEIEYVQMHPPPVLDLSLVGGWGGNHRVFSPYIDSQYLSRFKKYILFRHKQCTQDATWMVLQLGNSGVLQFLFIGPLTPISKVNSEPLYTAKSNIGFTIIPLGKYYMYVSVWYHSALSFSLCL